MRLIDADRLLELFDDEERYGYITADEVRQQPTVSLVECSRKNHKSSTAVEYVESHTLTNLRDIINDIASNYNILQIIPLDSRSYTYAVLLLYEIDSEHDRMDIPRSHEEYEFKELLSRAESGDNTR